eukprot:3840979-Heterocapsa_arctica.AAC.1
MIKVTGCALGMKTDKGVPMLKPWTIATNDPYVFNAFKGKLCPGKGAHPEHQNVGPVDQHN